MTRLGMPVLALVIAAAVPVTSQAPLRFEIVSIKPTPPETAGGGRQLLPGGRVMLRNTTLKALVAAAYQRSMWDSPEIVAPPKLKPARCRGMP
jgi:hypothetical protein